MRVYTHALEQGAHVLGPTLAVHLLTGSLEGSEQCVLLRSLGNL